MSFEKYVDYAMDVPMYFVYREGQYINALGQSWREFMEVRVDSSLFWFVKGRGCCYMWILSLLNGTLHTR
jgi:hypothetical protein